MNLSNISKILQINPRKKISNYSFSKVNGLFYLQKLFFKINDSSVSAIKGVGNLIAIIGPEVNASVKHIIFTLTKANTETHFSTGQIV